MTDLLSIATPGHLLPGLALSFIIGITLGMLGGGGSILTVPVFVYVLGYDPKLAIAMSYPVVGFTTLVGAVGRYRAGFVNMQRALIVGAASMSAAFVAARLSHGVKGTLQLVILGTVMLVSAVTMLRSASKADVPADAAPPRPAVLALVGLCVGTLTGLVGVGGGFLIVPALVGYGGVAMREAVGTSLLIITANCVAGFAGQHNVAALPWGGHRYLYRDVHDWSRCRHAARPPSRRRQSQAGIRPPPARGRYATPLAESLAVLTRGATICSLNASTTTVSPKRAT